LGYKHEQSLTLKYHKFKGGTGMSKEIKERNGDINRIELKVEKRNSKNKHVLDGWKTYKIKDLLVKVNNPVNVNINETYREIGIRSHGKGIFYKEPIMGKDLGNKSVFWIEPDCFIVNIVFAWELAVAKTTKNELGLIASHRFPMYRPIEDKLNVDFITYLFKSNGGKHLLSLASPGGAGRNKTLGQKEFGELEVTVPSNVEEQKVIAEILSTWDRVIELKEKLIEQKKEQKKGLLQKLLTGHIRWNDRERYTEAEIRDRLEIINEGKVPRGYKNNGFGIYPEDWTVKKFEELFTFSGSLSASREQLSNDGVCYLHYGDIHKFDRTYIDIENDYDNTPKLNVQEVDSKYFLHDGDIVFADASEDHEGIGKSITIYNQRSIPFIAGLHTITARDNSKLIVRAYKRFFLSDFSIRKQFMFFATGISVYGLSKNNLKKIVVSLPSIEEQDKIAEILSLAEKEIKCIEQEVETLKKQKKGLTQLLLTGKMQVKV
jgi:type I restriction enzyme S subunit